jgi:hypothetical protein
MGFFIKTILMKIRKIPKIYRNSLVTHIMNILMLEGEFYLQVDQTLVR